MSRRPAYLDRGFVAAGPGHVRCSRCGKLMLSNAYSWSRHRCSAEALRPGLVDLTWLLKRSDKRVGNERVVAGKWGAGIVHLADALGSRRFVLFQNRKAVAGLQVVESGDGARRIVANVYTDPEHRRRGHATALWEAARRAIGRIEHATPHHRSEDAKAWIRSLETIQRIGNGYPPDWPRCPSCGRPALDGHITCGAVECDESGHRG